MISEVEQRTNKDYPFLKGGGEMGELTRAHNWSATTLGDPEFWPQSLKTTISILLNSKFPMFLFWGPELICFYNDAYRPSLGLHGKHPSMLGSRAVDSWQEIWADIKPLINQVLSGGEASWSEDQLLPIYRNGKLEDVYWTFSYSPVTDESGKPAGVFVTCTETTDKVLARHKLQENNQQLQKAIESEKEAQSKIAESERKLRLVILQAPVAIAIMRSRNYIVEIANARALQMWAKEWQEVENKPIFEVMPELKSQGIQNIINEVYDTGKPFSATELEVQLWRNNRMETAFVNFVYEPLYDFYGKINGIITIGVEVTAQVLARRKIEESEKRFRTMAEGTNLLIAVGDETSNATYFNKAWTDLTGRSTEDLLQFGWADLVHPEDRDTYLNIYLSAFKEQKPFQGEFRILSKNGNYRWLLAQGPPRFHPNGSFAGYISSSIDITDRKQYQRELQASEQRLETILSQLPAPVVVLRGSNQIIETTNESLLSFWNKKREEVIGKPMLEVFPELKNQVYPSLWKYVLEKGEKLSKAEQEVIFNQPGGGQRSYFVDYYYQPLTDNNGNITAVLATIIDVTEKVQSRKLLENSQVKLQAINEELATINEELSSTNNELITSQKALQLLNKTLSESQSQLKFALDAADLGTWELNLATNCFTGNKRLKLWFGLQDEHEIDMQKAIDLIDPADQQRVVAAIQATLQNKLNNKYDIEYGIINPRLGSTRYVRAKGMLLYDEQNKPVRFLGTLQDITEERAASAKLEETNQRLKMALDAAKLGSYDLDFVSGNMNCTPQCKVNFGLETNAEFSYKNWVEAALPEHRDSLNNGIKTAIANHSIFEAEYQTQWPDNSTHWISIAGKPLYNTEGQAIRMTGVTLEITERKLDDLRKSDFIGMVSHELKTPLTSLSAFIQILNGKLKDSNDAFIAGLLDKASIQIKKMSTLINGFLNVSRFESGKINIVKQSFNLDDLLREVIKETELTVASHNIIFEQCEPVKINADRDKIGSVVSNLISNAVKYSSQGKTITVTCLVQENKARVSVQDEGIGIKPEDREKLFDRYYRVESNTTQHISGFGIGLYLSAEIIHRHNGDIWVESEAGKGSTFFFTLPLPFEH